MVDLINIPFQPRPALMNAAAEQSLLGALMTRPQLLDSLPTFFDPSHYGDPLNESIHRVLVEVGKPGVPAAILVRQALGIRDKETDTYISGLLTSVVSYQPSAIVSYASAVSEMHRRRGMEQIGQEMVASAHAVTIDGSADVGLSRALMSIEGLAVGQRDRRNITMIEAAAEEAIMAANDVSERGGMAGIATGFPSLDEALGGLEDGTVTVLGGRPGSGKTALGVTIAVNVARDSRDRLATGELVKVDRRGVAVFSLEMDARQLGRRTLCQLAGVPIVAMKQGRHGPYMDRIYAAQRELKDLPLFIEDGAGLTMAMMALRCRWIQRNHGLRLIMIDHLHIVKPNEASSRHGMTAGVTEVSGAAKGLAKEFGCPVLMLAQLNRSVESREDKRPGLSDLRQSGSIEQDADAVAFLYRAEYYMQNEPEQIGGESLNKFQDRDAAWRSLRERVRGKAEVILSKVRDGEPKTVHLMFDGPTASFTEPMRGY